MNAAPLVGSACEPWVGSTRKLLVGSTRKLLVGSTRKLLVGGARELWIGNARELCAGGGRAPRFGPWHRGRRRGASASEQPQELGSSLSHARATLEAVALVAPERRAAVLARGGGVHAHSDVA